MNEVPPLAGGDNAMSDADALWDRVRAAFKDHRTSIDQTPQPALNRIVAKCLGLSLDPSNCDVYEERLTLEELRQLKRYSENHPNPHFDVERPS
jgi:hypothetical protein